MTRWITNLESADHLVAQVAKAEAALDAAAPGEERRQASAMLEVAKFRQADAARTLRQIQIENGGRIDIGEPMGTQWRTAEEIAKDGIVGIYRQGAGDGPQEAKSVALAPG